MVNGETKSICLQLVPCRRCDDTAIACLVCRYQIGRPADMLLAQVGHVALFFFFSFLLLLLFQLYFRHVIFIALFFFIFCYFRIISCWNNIMSRHLPKKKTKAEIISNILFTCEQFKINYKNSIIELTKWCYRWADTLSFF